PAATLCGVLHLKREPMSAIACSLAVVVLPFVGPLLFALFGYQTVHRRRIARKQRRKSDYGKIAAQPPPEPADAPAPPLPRRWAVLADLARPGHGFPVT